MAGVPRGNAGHGFCPHCNCPQGFCPHCNSYSVIKFYSCRDKKYYEICNKCHQKLKVRDTRGSLRLEYNKLKEEGKAPDDFWIWAEERMKEQREKENAKPRFMIKRLSDGEKNDSEIKE